MTRQTSERHRHTKDGSAYLHNVFERSSGVGGKAVKRRRKLETVGSVSWLFISKFQAERRPAAQGAALVL